MIYNEEMVEFNDNSEDLLLGIEVALLILKQRGEYRKKHGKLNAASQNEKNGVNNDGCNDSTVDRVSKNYVESMKCFWKIYKGFDIAVFLLPDCGCEQELEHLQSPVGSDYLVEQWNIRYENTSCRQNSENSKRIEKYGLIQAVSSQLHFSQLNSWWCKTSGHALKNVVCVVVPPNSSDPGNHTILSHEFKSLHIDNKFLLVSVKSRPRWVSIPNIHCTGHNGDTAWWEDPPNSCGFAIGSNSGRNVLTKHNPTISKNKNKPYEKEEPFEGFGTNMLEKNVKRIPDRGRLLGSFEDSVLEHRMYVEKIVVGYTVEFGCSGSSSPDNVQFPVMVEYFTFTLEPISKSYLAEGEVTLKKGYTIANDGNLQVTLKNAEESVVTVFLIPYNFSDMPPNSTTIMRHKIFYVPPEETAQTKKRLRYLLQLRIKCSKSGRIAIYSKVQIIVCEVSTVVKVDELLRDVTQCITEYPKNPKYFHC